MIKNQINERVYIGRSLDIKARWEEHKMLLNNNIHHNIELQNDWNTYPKECFKFQILERCWEDESKYKEIYYFFQFENIYNHISTRYKFIFKACTYLDNLHLNDLKYRYSYHTTYKKYKIHWDLYVKYKDKVVLLFNEHKDDWENKINYLNAHKNIILINNIIKDDNIEYIIDKFKTNIDSIVEAK